MRHISIYIGAMLFAGPLLAEESLLNQYRDTADQCFENVSYLGEESTCRGLVFAACNQGSSIDECMLAEAVFWEEKVDKEYQRAFDELQRQDDIYPVIEPEPQLRTDALRAAQQAWVAFRDFQCQLDLIMIGSAAPCREEHAFFRAMDMIDLQEPLQ